jgi:hypothetical protein
MRLRSLLILGALAFVVGALALAACGGEDFDPASKVNSVRIFGVRADKPYAKPGETVTLEALFADGRLERPRPLRMFWIPIVCINPREDLYYLCFAPAEADAGRTLVAPFPIVDAGLSDGGAAAALTQIPTGVDLSALVPQGPTFQFQMPPDAIAPRLGSEPYGLAIIFNIACAGQVRLGQRTGANPQQVPIQCTDEQGNQLGPNDYVIGINRVYSYSDQTNSNPTIEKLTVNGADLDVAKGIVVARCTEAKKEDCPSIKIDVKVPPASWEANPSSGQGEQIWVTYYSDIGELENDARLLYDTRSGRVSESDVEYRAAQKVGDGNLWAVVHDNRAGAAFVTVPIHVQ